MHIAVSSLLLVVGLTKAQNQGYHLQYSTGQFDLRTQQDESQTSAPAEYNYSYDVRDDITGDRKSQEETRSGDVVRGRYSLLDADGSTRTVEYSVDSHSGFNAVVRRDGDQISLPNQNTRPSALNSAYHSSRPSAPQAFRNRYQGERVDSRTRLAQDARTGNVVDLHTGFGSVPQAGATLQPTPVPRVQSVNRYSLDNVQQEQVRNDAYDGRDGQRHHGDVQEISARSAYQAYHHPINHHLSTAPIHFPGFGSGAFSRSHSLYNQHSTRSQAADVRRPSALFSESNNANTPDNRSNDGASGQNAGEASNANYPDVNTFNQNVHYATQQEVTNGPTTPVPVQPSYGPTPQTTYLETNNSRIAQYDHSDYFGARLNANNIPAQTFGSVSVQDDAVITNAAGSSTPSLNTAYSEPFVTPAPTPSFQDVHRIPGLVNTDAASNNDRAQSYLYPASTLPLNADQPAHFFTGDHLNNDLSQVNIHDFDVHIPHFNHLTVSPVHYAEPIVHDVHLLK